MTNHVPELPCQAATPSLPDDKHFHFGSRETSNLLLLVGQEAGQTSFHVHWEILSSASSFFEKMKSVGMAEARENQVRLAGECPQAWKALITRLYPPLEEFTIESAVLVVPLVDMLELSWMLPELTRVLSRPESSASRTPEFADILCTHGLAGVLSDWFAEKGANTAWAAASARQFVASCKHADAVRSASTFIIESVRGGVRFLSTAQYNSVCVNYNCQNRLNTDIAAKWDESSLKNWL